MSFYKNLYHASLRVCLTAPVDDDFPMVLHDFQHAVTQIRELPRTPKIVCLCGSTKFKKEFEEIEKNLTFAGYIVLTVGCFGHADDVPLTDKGKAALDELHLRKIELADEVFVINKDGYIGESTRREIFYAKTLKQGRQITYLEPINER